MKYKSRHAGESIDPLRDGGDVPLSVRLDIVDPPQPRPGGGSSGHGSGGGGGGGGGVGSGSYFVPQPEQTPWSGTRTGGKPGAAKGCGTYHAPEKRLTLFALRLAVLEKVASGLGALAFLWATIVLLGGFVSDIRVLDFWCITVVLVSEGARVFGRSRELEWQRHATGGVLRFSSRFFRRVVISIVDRTSDAPERRSGGTRAVAAYDAYKAEQFQDLVVRYMKRRAWHAPDVSLLPYTRCVFVSKNISRVLYFLQVLSALTCVALSVMRLWNHDYELGEAKNNRRQALLLFYTLALAEAALFLLEKAYWKVSFRRLLEQVSQECELGVYGLVSLERFFYSAYSECITGSIFDGIKMDLVTFAEELIKSDFLDEQLIGVHVLRQLSTSETFAAEALRKVGTSARCVERLVEMLSWKRPEEEEVRRCAAEVVSKLAGRSQNALRVAAIPGAVESVMSLLSTGHAGATGTGRPHEASLADHSYDYLQFNLIGLLILKKLARDHDNCGKIGNTRGLLAKIVDFTQAPPALLRNQVATDSHIRTVKRALQVLKMLVGTAGKTGKMLRQEVAEIVFTVSNLRGILQHGQQRRELQLLAIDVLTGLAMDDTTKEVVAGTGGVVKLLLSIFVDDNPVYDCDAELRREAGEALALLVLESERNCDLMLKRSDVLDRLISALRDKERRLNAARILRNLCAYSAQELSARLQAATAAMPLVLKATMTEKERLLEVSIGLTTQICHFIGCEEFTAELRKAGIEEEAYVQRMMSILREYKYPDIKVPRMRRFVVQQAIWLMRSPCDGYVRLLRELGMERLLESIADTTSDLECFHVFSGSVGLSHHRKSFSAIVETALELLAGGQRQTAAAARRK